MENTTRRYQIGDVVRDYAGRTAVVWYEADGRPSELLLVLQLSGGERNTTVLARHGFTPVTDPQVIKAAKEEARCYWTSTRQGTLRAEAARALAEDAARWDRINADPNRIGRALAYR
jgi:hypothetical protein